MTDRGGSVVVNTLEGLLDGSDWAGRLVIDGRLVDDNGSAVVVISLSVSSPQFFFSHWPRQSYEQRRIYVKLVQAVSRYGI